MRGDVCADHEQGEQRKQPGQRDREREERADPC